MSLEVVEVNPEEPSNHSVIWLHGLGADGHDFEPIVGEITSKVPIRYVFPHAPVRAVTINQGMRMRAWYDIVPGSPLSGEDDIRASASMVQELIDAEKDNGVPTRNIVLAGFSQGGVIALHVALRATYSLAGVLALSTYVHNVEHIENEVSLDSIDTPIFMAHGMGDPMIPIARAVSSRNKLSDLNYDVEWHQYGMGHQVSLEEIVDISQFLNRVFSETD